jgi:glyoxylase-like metal-dependent hydrolase (beta-lactamase superfamily II)
MQHNRDFDPRYGEAVELVPGVRRLTARNPGPFTFHGTNSYLIGSKHLVAIDPGPAMPEHIDTILKATEGATIEAILVTHTHMDHSPGARLLREKTGAPIIGCEAHRAARELLEDEINPLDASADKIYRPDKQLEDGEVFTATEFSLETVSTPGHTANHLCFAIRDETILLSADHVMGWSTSIVAPPDGNMRDYMNSIDKLLNRPEQTYLPGHGEIIRQATSYTRDLKQHRLGRETAILSKLAEAACTIPEIVSALYANVDPSLHPAAGLSVFAHLEDLVTRGQVSAVPGLSLKACFNLRS